MTMLLTRRQVVEGCAIAAGLMICGGASAAFGESSQSLRPPGGQDATNFIAKCLRCDRCRSVCPQGCISIMRVEEGFASARTPKLDFRKGYCDFCGKCIEVCPTGALLPFDESADEVGVAVVDFDECLAYRSVGCRVCYEKCPFDAIGLGANNEPVVNADACNGCGVCENQCPSASFGSYSGSQKRGINVEPVGVERAERGRAGASL